MRKTGDTKGTNFREVDGKILTTEAQRRTDGPSYSPPPAESKNQENQAEKMDRTKAFHAKKKLAPANKTMAKIAFCTPELWPKIRLLKSEIRVRQSRRAHARFLVPRRL
jgi:hypothetical protein